MVTPIDLKYVEAVLGEFLIEPTGLHVVSDGVCAVNCRADRYPRTKRLIETAFEVIDARQVESIPATVTLTFRVKEIRR